VHFSDLLLERHVDLRWLPFSERERDLARLCKTGRKAVPCLRLSRASPKDRRFRNDARLGEHTSVTQRKLCAARINRLRLDRALGELHRVTVV
jgi:hypothetical protein